MKKALWLVLAALPLAFAAAPAPSKGSMQSKPAVTHVVKKGLKKAKHHKHHTVKRKVLRHAKHVTKKASTHKMVKPVKKP
ncbi:MAG: hypothetical protein ACOYW9_10360 [Deinococcota bacterium]|uniref:Acid shock protein n=1 Tax=Allomeiothermus silvanus (strain ATCC 700542 / DSM 9946 / NBRC 106475 / NCIMB 13440 / VI-R2) TaxID=526227 RepID=D7BBT7_ALLS1|nr:hypothetical protein [Allomeiothermus silvanus]ADH62733.1 hypothetical protein Mesil_0820 [Allomeiothermus silvanus DSM 9946]MBI5812376.1 hypothetical protein [Allomeiothermus silvanus]